MHLRFGYFSIRARKISSCCSYSLAEGVSRPLYHLRNDLSRFSTGGKALCQWERPHKYIKPSLPPNSRADFGNLRQSLRLYFFFCYLKALRYKPATIQTQCGVMPLRCIQLNPSGKTFKSTLSKSFFGFWDISSWNTGLRIITKGKYKFFLLCLRQYHTKIVVQTRSQLFRRIIQNDAGIPAYFFE